MASAGGLKFLEWFGVLYHLFPAVSYLVTKDWKKVFYDCFGPEILAAEAFTSIITLWYHIFGPPKTNNMVSVILHAFGLCLNVMSICLFAMYHSLSGGMKKAKYWYYIVLGKFALVTLLTFMWIQMGITMDGANDMRAYFGYLSAAIVEVFQILWPAIVRVIKKNYVSDEKPIFWLKVIATILMSIGVSSFEFWEMSEENFWSNHIGRRFMVLSMINIIGGTLQLVVRYIGPEHFADPIDKIINQCHQWTAEKMEQFIDFFRGWND